MEKKKSSKKKPKHGGVDSDEFQAQVLEEYRTAVKSLQADLRRERSMRQALQGRTQKAEEQVASLRSGLSELRTLTAEPTLSRGKLIALADKLTSMTASGCDSLWDSHDEEDDVGGSLGIPLSSLSRTGDPHRKPNRKVVSAPASPRSGVKQAGRRTLEFLRRSPVSRPLEPAHEAPKFVLTAKRTLTIDRTGSHLPVTNSLSHRGFLNRTPSLATVLSGMDMAGRPSRGMTFTPSREPSASSCSTASSLGAAISRHMSSCDGAAASSLCTSLTTFLPPLVESNGPPSAVVRLRSRSLPALPSWDLASCIQESDNSPLAPRTLSDPKATPGILVGEQVFSRMLKKSRQLTELTSEAAEELASSDGSSSSTPQLIFEDLPGKGKVLMAGQIVAVIDYLYGEDQHRNDGLDNLLLTHTRYISSVELLDLFSSTFLTTSAPYQSKELTKLSTVLCFWLKAYPRCFSTNSALKAALIALIDTHIKTVSQSAAKYLHQLLENRLEALAEEQVPPLPLVEKYTGPSLELLDVHPKDIARELTLRESRSFRLMSADCLISKNREEHPSVVAVVGLFNHVSHWAATEVLATASCKKKASVIVHLIAVAKQLQSIHNFASMMQIVSGLTMQAVKRLKRTWKLVPKKAMLRLERMTELLEPGKNYAVYKKCLAESSLPAIPYVGIYLRNATLIEDGNPSILKNGMVNMEKIRMLGMLVREVRYFQLSVFDFKRTPRASHLIENMKPVTQPDALYALSYHSEPRTVL